MAAWRERLRAEAAEAEARAAHDRLVRSVHEATQDASDELVALFRSRLRRASSVASPINALRLRRIRDFARWQVPFLIPHRTVHTMGIMFRI